MRRFESARRLQKFPQTATGARQVKEGRGGGTVDAADLKSATRKGVWVRVPLPAPAGRVQAAARLGGPPFLVGWVEVDMSVCAVCHGKNLQEQLVDKVFNVNGRYVLVTGIPTTVCRNCGERSFSGETTEKVRRLVHSGVNPKESVSMPVYEFA